MSNRKPFLIIFLLLFSSSLFSSDKSVIGFYNVENMFDHIDDPLTDDYEFTPRGRNRWTEKKAKEKIVNISSVISAMSLTGQKTKGPDIVGLAEVENSYVLDILVNDTSLIDSDYAYVHYDSPDVRGIDVALMYKKASFEVINSKAVPVDLGVFSSRPTRDILYVEGKLKGETVHFLVNHWPSRSAGVAATRAYRMAAAKTAKKIIDEVNEKSKNAKVILMGDLNDNPVDQSLVVHLNAKNLKDSLENNDLFNPFYASYKKGIGSNAYQDTWFNFDQILVSNNLVKGDKGWKFRQSQVFNKSFLIQQSGRFKNHPLRTMNDTGRIGYSDHFPVLVILETAN